MQQNCFICGKHAGLEAIPPGGYIVVEGAPHFHTWLVPRFPGEQVRGPALLAEEAASEEMAARLAETLRRRLAQ